MSIHNATLNKEACDAAKEKGWLMSTYDARPVRVLARHGSSPDRSALWRRPARARQEVALKPCPSAFRDRGRAPKQHRKRSPRVACPGHAPSKRRPQNARPRREARPVARAPGGTTPAQCDRPYGVGRRRRPPLSSGPPAPRSTTRCMY